MDKNIFCIHNYEIFIKNKNEIFDLTCSGKIGIFPTDTVYGIGVKVTNIAGCKKIYEIKHRPENKPLPLVIAEIKQLYEITGKDIPEIIRKIIDKYWPGPVTIVVKTMKDDKSVAIRLPDHKILREIINYIGEPLALTSANISGEKSPVKISDISAEIIKNVDFVIDTGECKYKKESTIVDWNGKVLREGVVKKEEIEQIIKKECI